MKNSILILSLALALSACGSDDKKSDASAIGTDNSPSVVVPANAHLSDYDCVERQEFTENGVARTLDVPSKGVNSYWKDSGYSFSYDQESDGSFKALAKYRKTAIDASKYKQESELTSWALVEGKWMKYFKTTLRVWEKNGSIRRVISNQENGVDNQPYYWEIEDSEINEKTTRSVQRHTRPEARNRNGLVFSKIEVTCTYTDR